MNFFTLISSHGNYSRNAQHITKKEDAPVEKTGASSFFEDGKMKAAGKGSKALSSLQNAV